MELPQLTAVAAPILCAVLPSNLSLDQDLVLARDDNSMCPRQELCCALQELPHRLLEFVQE